MSDSAYSPTWHNLKCNVETGNIVSYSPDVDFVRLTEFLCSVLASADPRLDSKLKSVRTTSKKRPEGKGKTARKAKLTSKTAEVRRGSQRSRVTGTCICAGSTQVPVT